MFAWWCSLAKITLLNQHCNWDKDLGMETDWSCMFTITISVHHPTVKSPIPYSTMVKKTVAHWWVPWLKKLFFDFHICTSTNNISFKFMYTLHFCAERSHTRPDDQLLILDSVISVCMMMHWEYIDVSCETTEDDILAALIHLVYIQLTYLLSPCLVPYVIYSSFSNLWPVTYLRKKTPGL